MSTDESDAKSALQIGLDFIHRYNDCFYRKDMDALRELYSADAFSVFWDNHAGCDATELRDHFNAVGAFFAKGKETESGDVEPLMVEDARAHQVGDSLLITAILRYASVPKPGVRSTLWLVLDRGAWRAAHIQDLCITIKDSLDLLDLVLFWEISGGF